MNELSTPDLIRKLRGTDTICEPDCTCHGTAACRYCGGTGTYIGGDELHVCWCRQEAAAAREAL
jgi:hypothetical protein